MKETVERKTCDVCLCCGQETEVDLYLTSFEPISDWLEINSIDVCPHCAWIIRRASQMGWLADIVAACDEAFDWVDNDQKPSQG